MLAQRRDQILPEIVTGLKEEMIFEISLKMKGSSSGKQRKGIPCTTKIEEIMVVMIFPLISHIT